MQGDIRFADVLEKMGATICWGDDYISCTRGELNAIDMDMNHIPDAANDHCHGGVICKRHHHAAQYL